MTAAVSPEHQATADALERMLTWARRINPMQGISALTFSTMDTLATAGPMRISELAEREGVTQPGMTGLVNRLEAEGLAVRATDPSDGRAALVSITTAGSALLNAHRADRAAAIATRVSDLGEHDQAALLAVLPAIQHLTTDLTSRPA